MLLKFTRYIGGLFPDLPAKYYFFNLRDTIKVYNSLLIILDPKKVPFRALLALLVNNFACLVKKRGILL